MARHRRFSLEFKRQVVLDFLERRMGLRELARKHNLSRNLLSQWVRKYETGQLTDEIVDAVRIAEYEGRSRSWNRKVGQLTMEIDLLKKGAQLARRPNVEHYAIVSGPQIAPSHADVERCSWRVRLTTIAPADQGRGNRPCRNVLATCAKNLRATVSAG